MKSLEAATKTVVFPNEAHVFGRWLHSGLTGTRALDRFSNFGPCFVHELRLIHLDGVTMAELSEPKKDHRGFQNETLELKAKA